jgi:hypothetical protein
MKVWVVAESRFEWFEIKHICASKEVALKRWEELRAVQIKENQEMVDYCKEGGVEGSDWQDYITKLKNLTPGETCDCNCPDLKEWEVET